MPTATKNHKTAAPATSKRVVKKAAPAPPTPVKLNHRGQIQVRLPQDLIDRLDDESERRRVSKTFLVEQILSATLPRWEEQEISAL